MLSSICIPDSLGTATLVGAENIVIYLIGSGTKFVIVTIQKIWDRDRKIARDNFVR